MTEARRVHALAERVASLSTLELADLLGIIGVLLAARKVPVGIEVTQSALAVIEHACGPDRVDGASIDWLRIATRVQGLPPASA